MFEVDEYTEKSDEEVDDELVIKEEKMPEDIPHESEMGETIPKINFPEKAKEILEGKIEFNDSEDEKGLECSLEREISVEETLLMKHASKDRKNSVLKEIHEEQEPKNTSEHN